MFDIAETLQMLVEMPDMATSSQRAMTGHANNGKSRFNPSINRHTGKPHEHRREIARRDRQSMARERKFLATVTA